MYDWMGKGNTALQHLSFAFFISSGCSCSPSEFSWLGIVRWITFAEKCDEKNEDE